MNRRRAYRAILVDTWREARSRQVTRILWGLVLAVLLFFLFGVDLDVSKGHVQGCGCSSAGTPVDPAGPGLERFVRGLLQRWFFWLAFIATLMTSILVSAQWVPQTFTRGTVDRFLARPLGRAEFLLVRQASSFSLVVVGNILLVFGIFLITGIKTGIYLWPFLLAGTVVPLVIFLAVYGYMTLVGVLTESVPACAVVGFLTFFGGWGIESVWRELQHRYPEQTTIWKAVVWLLHTCLPRVEWMRGLGRAWIKGEPAGPVHVPFLVNGAVIAAVFAAAVLAFRRRDY